MWAIGMSKAQPNRKWQPPKLAFQPLSLVSIPPLATLTFPNYHTLCWSSKVLTCQFLCVTGINKGHHSSEPFRHTFTLTHCPPHSSPPNFRVPFFCPSFCLFCVHLVGEGRRFVIRASLRMAGNRLLSSEHDLRKLQRYGIAFGYLSLIYSGTTLNIGHFYCIKNHCV